MASTTLASARIAILSLLFFTASSSWLSANHNTANLYEAFFQCFVNYTRCSNTSEIIYTPNTTSYENIFRTSVRNQRFLAPETTKPTAIVTPTDPSHVQAAVTCGKAAGLQARVCSGGHDYEGLSYVSSGDAFVIINLINLRSVAIDTTGNTAWVGAGASVGEVYHNIASKSRTLGFPASVCTTVGVGGLFSGGGIGTLMRRYGVSADNVVDATMVDADGKLLDRESMGEDLFWAIRGGGASNFGVVLSFKINLVHVPAVVTVFRIRRTLEQGATQLVERWQHVAPQLDDGIFIRILVSATAGDKNATRSGRTIQAMFECLFLGGQDGLLRLLGTRFPELGVETGDLIETSWVNSTLFFAGFTNATTAALLERRLPYNSSFKGKSDFVREPISEEGWKKIFKVLLDSPGEQLTMIMDPWGGKMDEINEAAIPFPHRKGNLYNIQHFMWWAEAGGAAAQKHLDWMRKFYDYIAPFVSKNPRAAYVNYKDIDLGRNVEGEGYQGSSTWGSKYFLDNFERLGKIKANVDPDNYFRNEQSIPPLMAA